MKSLKTFLKMIKLEHSVFALPFAIIGMFLAANGLPSASVFLWVIVAMVSARSVAMGLNRFADAEIDARNSRTASREIPKGTISKKETMLYTTCFAIIYFFSTYMLNTLTLILSPLPIIIFVLYSYAKRFTNWCHIILGFALGFAPVGAWIAVQGSVAPAPFIICVAVLCWVAGFDILYAIQDIEFDRKEKLHSIPAKLGIEKTIILAKILHTISFLFFFSLSFFSTLGVIYLSGLLITAALMIYEHRLISKDNLTKLNIAFFNMNAYISLTIMVFSLLDIFIKL